MTQVTESEDSVYTKDQGQLKFTYNTDVTQLEAKSQALRRGDQIDQSKNEASREVLVESRSSPPVCVPRVNIQTRGTGSEAVLLDAKENNRAEGLCVDSRSLTLTLADTQDLSSAMPQTGLITTLHNSSLCVKTEPSNMGDEVRSSATVKTEKSEGSCQDKADCMQEVTHKSKSTVLFEGQLKEEQGHVTPTEQDAHVHKWVIVNGNIKPEFQYSTSHEGSTQQDNLKKSPVQHQFETPVFQCDTRHKHFACKSNLKSHQTVHIYEKPFQCDTCHKCYGRKSGLTRHQRLHTGGMPYQCDTCHKHFARKTELKSHQRLHTGEKPFQCDTCHKCFAWESCLKRQQRVHTGEKP